MRVYATLEAELFFPEGSRIDEDTDNTVLLPDGSEVTIWPVLEVDGASVPVAMGQLHLLGVDMDVGNITLEPE